jgi:hypothetical protein
LATPDAALAAVDTTLAALVAALAALPVSEELVLPLVVEFMLNASDTQSSWKN